LVNSKPTTPGVEAAADATAADSVVATSRVDRERIVAFKWEWREVWYGRMMGIFQGIANLNKYTTGLREPQVNILDG
jgi:hypothetical protein